MPRDLVLSFPPTEEPPALGGESELRRRAAEKLAVPASSLAGVRVSRISFDARRRRRAWRVALSVFDAGETPPPPPATEAPTYAHPARDAPHVVVIGSGPAGLFAALDLLASGLAVTVLERGRDVRTRRKPIRAILRGQPVDPDCNYAFGEGGAGTYSDGKLYTRSGKKRDVRGVLETLVAHGAPPEILVSWRPHVGSNRLPEVVRSMRETIRRSGGAVRFGQRAEELLVKAAPGVRAAPGMPRRIAGVRVRVLDTGEVEELDADAVVLATGHSALDAVEMARRAGARLEPKGFALGVRIEHRQAWLDERQYGGLRGPCDLPASFYELSTQVEGRGVYSFCMCPGGFVVPSSSAPDRLVLNGMSLSRRDSPFANSGLVVALEPEDWCGTRGRALGWEALLERARTLAPPGRGLLSAPLPEAPDEDPLCGIRLQHAVESLAAAAGGGANRAPAQRADQVAEGSGGGGRLLPTSYRPGVTAADLADVLPAGVLDRLRAGLVAFEGHLPGFASEDGQVLGVETRTSSPVRIVRDPETLACVEVEGLHPAGEGAGHAGGIVSAALDGRRVAAAIVARADVL